MGHHDDGGAQVLVGRLDQLDDVGGGPMVELAGRLVREQQLRPVGQGDGDGEPLLLTAGQPAGGPAGDPRQADRVEQVCGPAAFGGPGAARWALGVQDVARGGRIVQQVTPRILHNDADFAQPHLGGCPGGQVTEPPAADLRDSGGGLQQAREQPQQGRFPGTGRAEQGDGVGGTDCSISSVNVLAAAL